MKDRKQRYMGFALAVIIIVVTGVLVSQFYVWKRLDRLNDRIGRIHTLSNRDEYYRALRVVPPEQRSKIYPAGKTFRPGSDDPKKFGDRLRDDLERWIELDRDLMEKPVRLTSLGVETIDSVRIVREKVEFRFDGDDCRLLRGYLLYRSGGEGKLPGVFCLNGHAGTARAVAGLEEDYTHGYALGLADIGFKVLTFDWCFEGESELRDESGNEFREHEGLFGYARMTGRTELALYLENAWCAMKALKSDPMVDPERIGITGISRGGELTTYFAALFPEEIIAYYASGAGFPFIYRRFGGGCKCTYVEPLFDNYEYSDLLIAAAPTPGRLQLGTHDGIWGYWDNIGEIMGTVEPVYAGLGVPNEFGLDIHGGEHEYRADQAAAFFKRNLME